MTLWLPHGVYAVLSSLAKRWGESRTAVITRLILESKGKELKVE